MLKQYISPLLRRYKFNFSRLRRAKTIHFLLTTAAKAQKFSRLRRAKTTHFSLTTAVKAQNFSRLRRAKWIEYPLVATIKHVFFSPAAHTARRRRENLWILDFCIGDFSGFESAAGENFADLGLL